MLHPKALFKQVQQWRHQHLQIDRFAVLVHVRESGALVPRYAFMTVMACGIALLGLLQNSAAVIIGAMLISPLMGPIVEMGMALATFDFRALRTALVTLTVGVGLALLTSILIVTLSPLRETTPEILARTEPTLFDLMVAVFSGLAGAYAMITRKGETIVGVAIATALMPPLAVVGFGIAIGNVGIASGAFFLFMTNLLAIALSVTIIARWYGFGHNDSPKQTAWQAALIFGAFTLLSVPLGFALRDIAARGTAERTVRTVVETAAREGSARVGSLRIERGGDAVGVEAMLLTPKPRPQLAMQLERKLEAELGRPVTVDLREVMTADGTQLAQDQSSLTQLRERVDALRNTASREAQDRSERASALSGMQARALGHFGQLDVLEGGRRAVWRLNPESGLDIASARRLETALMVEAGTIRVQVVPALRGLPAVTFGERGADLDAARLAALEDNVWALQRWQMPAVHLIGHEDGDVRLAQERLDVVTQWLRDRGVTITVAEVASPEASRQLAAREGAGALGKVLIVPAP